MSGLGETQIETKDNTLVIFEEKGLFGAKNQTGQIVIEPQYIEMQPFCCGLAQVRNGKYQYAYINATNQLIVPFGRYAWCDPQFVYGFARVMNYTRQNEKRWGIINTFGDVLLPLKYENIWSLKEEYIHSAKAFVNGKEIHLDVGALAKDNILDGLVYHRTYSVEEIKILFGVSKIHVKQNPKTRTLFMTFSTIIGEVATKGIPTRPKISIVSNVNGKLFLLLHEAEDTGKESFYEPTISKNNEMKYNSWEKEYSSWEERDYGNDWRELMDDAFEGDESNYWNID